MDGDHAGDHGHVERVSVAAVSRPRKLSPVELSTLLSEQAAERAFEYVEYVANFSGQERAVYTVLDNMPLCVAQWDAAQDEVLAALEAAGLA